MYTGTLIDELIETVERAEQHAQQEAELSKAYWFAVSTYELESSLVGVA